MVYKKQTEILLKKETLQTVLITCQIKQLSVEKNNIHGQTKFD